MISTPARNQQSPQSSLAGWPLAQQRFQRASRAARDSLAGRSLQRPSLASGPRAPAPAGVRPPETLPPLRPGAPARAWRVLRSAPRSAPRHPRASCGQSSYCWPQAQQLAAAAGTPQTRHRRRRHTSLGTALSRREAREGSCELDKRFDLTDRLDTGSTQARLILVTLRIKNSRAQTGSIRMATSLPWVVSFISFFKDCDRKRRTPKGGRRLAHHTPLLKIPVASLVSFFLSLTIATRRFPSPLNLRELCVLICQQQT